MNKKVVLIISSVYLIILVWALFKDLDTIENTNLSKSNTQINLKLVDAVEMPIDAQTGLIIGPGYSLIQKNCLGCHSGKIIAQNRGARSVWLGTIRWMQQTQNLWDLGDDEAPILDYLSNYYAPEAQGRRIQLNVIEWYELNEFQK